VAHRSARSKCGIERLTQSRIAEWLEQALHGALFEQAGTDSLISVSGDVDDRNLLLAKGQFALQIRSAHARHGDVEDQTPGLTDAIGLEDGKLAEHWDVIQDEVKKEASRSGLPMFGDKFPT
jgi:hypothetical protein